MQRYLRGVITLVVGLALTPVIVTSVEDLTGVGKPLADSPAGSLLDLLPFVYIAGIITLAVSMFISDYKRGR